MRPQWGIVVASVATLVGALVGGLVATAVAVPRDASAAAPALGATAELHRVTAPAAPKAMTPPVEAPPTPEPGREAVSVEAGIQPNPAGPAADVEPAASCETVPVGPTGAAPSAVSPSGVAGTRTDDLAAFAQAYNAIRVAHCLPPIPSANFRYDPCMEARLFWIAEDPSTDTSSAWGHIGSARSDGVPSVGCDGNLAGGMNNTGATFARKWWDSAAHRTSLYKPGYTGSTAAVCVYLAVTHGGVPDEPDAFARAAARWGGC